MKLTENNVAYLNERLLEEKKEKSYELKHGDLLKISNTIFLLHIHSGLNTCIHCEPGEVMSKASKQEENNSRLAGLSLIEKEKLRRNCNREIKKKYKKKIFNEIFNSSLFLNFLDLVWKKLITNQVIKV